MDYNNSDYRNLLSNYGDYLIIDIMQPPKIDNSTKEERRAYVLEAWKCLHDCEACGKCRILRGRDPETLYADYIESKQSYMDVTLEIRERSMR